MGRMEKVNHMIKKEIGMILQQEFADPRLEFVTVTDVEVSRDLQHARVYYSVLGDAQKFSEAGGVLKNARGRIRRLLGQRIRIRYTPDIEFLADRSVEHGARIDQTLEEIRHEHDKGH